MEMPGSKSCCPVPRTCVRVASDIQSRRRRPEQVIHGMSQRSRTICNGPAVITLPNISKEGLVPQSTDRHATCTWSTTCASMNASARSLMSQRQAPRINRVCGRRMSCVQSQAAALYRAGLADRQTAGGRALGEPGTVTVGRRRMRSARRARCRVSWECK